MNLFISTRPVPKGRPRAVNKRMITPKKTRIFERTVSYMAKQYMRERALQILDEPIRVKLVFQYAYPKIKKEFKEGDIHYYVGLSDIDNLIKAMLDGLQGVCYTNDRLIVEVNAMKIYSRFSGISVSISKVNV